MLLEQDSNPVCLARCIAHLFANSTCRFATFSCDDSRSLTVADLLRVQVIERLTERRIVVEKAVSTLGEAPTGLRDVFELCRGFEKAFSNIVNVGYHEQWYRAAGWGWGCIQSQPCSSTA